MSVNNGKHIYLVVTRSDAVFSEEDATNFARQIDEPTIVVERTLYYGQPPVRGYNK